MVSSLDAFRELRGALSPAALTVIEQPTYEIGIPVVELMIQRLEVPSHTPRESILNRLDIPD